MIVICIFLGSVIGILYCIGYGAVEFFGFPMGEDDVYTTVGIIIIICGVSLITIGYLIGHASVKFFRWTWKNIKIAIAEAREA